MPSTAQRVMEQYPQFAFLLRDPQVGPLLAKATNPYQPWSPLKFQAELQKTQWYRRNSAAQRKNLILANTDPATYKSSRYDFVESFKRYAAQIGISVTGPEALWIGTSLFNTGRSPTGIEAQRALLNLLRHNPKKGTVGAIGRSQHMVNAQQVGEWLYPLAPKTIADWGTRVALGVNTLEDYNMLAAKGAAKLYPWLAQEIAGGSTMKDILGDRAAAYAAELDLTPDQVLSTIAYNKGSKEAQLIGIRDPKSGKMRLPTMSEVQKMARLDSRWWGSSKGRETDATMAANILNVFGKRKMGSV